MNDTATTDEAEGFWVHFTGTRNVAIGTGPTETVVFSYGMELFVTPRIVELSKGRDGQSRLLAAIEAGNGVERGRWPEAQSRLEPGSLDYADAREAARKAAWSLDSEDERRQALAKVRADFGDFPTSRTLATIRGDA